jgi:SAM-dependent methyltransferase
MILPDPDSLPSPRLYAELAEWWPLLSPPSHYTEEAAELVAILESASTSRPRTLLELGCGGGSMAYHLKEHFTLTLTDRSPQMLAVSQAANPECEHQVGDMQSLDLGRQFDAVLIHDAIAYAASREAVFATLATAHRHCRPGGVLIAMPDHVTETFQPTTSVGGEDGADGRGLRFVEWAWDPNPADETYDIAYAFLLRHADGTLSTHGDRHRLGLFARDFWMASLREAGFRPRALTSFGRTVFVAVRDDITGRVPGPESSPPQSRGLADSTPATRPSA